MAFHHRQSGDGEKRPAPNGRREEGESSLGFVAQELGLGVRNFYASLERRGLPTTNIDPQQLTTGE